MSRVNLSPARLAVLVALVVGGIAVMLNGFGDEGSAVAGGSSDVVDPTDTGAPSPTDAASPTETETPPPDLEPQVEGVVIQVLNGTNETGLAAEADQFLTSKGYEQGLAPGDIATKPVSGTTVYFRTGDDAEQNEVDAQHLADRFLKGVEATVRPLNDALGSDVAPRTQLVVVLGEDYAEANPVG
jgi:hypothetical protein